MTFVTENIQARVKHKVAKTNRDKTQQSVYEAVIREINNITAEDWSRAIGNIKIFFLNFCECFL